MTKRTAPIATTAPADRARLETIAAAPIGRWQKGGPSPNPKGRPPKLWEGPVTTKMNKIVEVAINGQLVKLTLRELLDRLVQQEAGNQGGRWLKLWRSRQAYDATLQQRFADPKAKPHPSAESLQFTHDYRDFLRSLAEQTYPGLAGAIATIAKLKERGIRPANRYDAAP